MSVVYAQPLPEAISNPARLVHKEVQFSGNSKRSFKIYGIWPQARTLTHFRNAVLLVWGSPRLTQAHPNKCRSLCKLLKNVCHLLVLNLRT